MAFQFRSSATITAEMIARITAMAPQITDYTEGGIVRSLAETVADELQQLDEAVYAGLREAINTAVYKAFSFNRKPASYALGIERFVAIPGIIVPVTIPVGTPVMVPGSAIQYTVTQQGVINPAPAPNFIDLPIMASVPGSIGNTPANTITLQGGVFNIQLVSNLQPVVSGQDQESDQQRFNRFQNYIAGLTQATLPAIRALALSTSLTDANGNIYEGVQNALVEEPFLEGQAFLGHVLVYIDNGTGSASPALVAAVTNNLAGYTDSQGVEHLGSIGAGVDFQVLPVTPMLLSLTVGIILLPGADPVGTPQLVQTAVINYLMSLRVNDEAVLNQIDAVVIGVGGILDDQLATPDGIVMTTNVIPPNGYRITPGVITVVVVGSFGS